MTLACIQSIKANTTFEHNIILVQSGTDVVPAEVAEDYVDTYVWVPDGVGAVTATNIGLAIALQNDNDHVMILDNDTTIPEGDKDWLERMVAELVTLPNTAAVGATSDAVNQPQQILSVPQTYTADWKGEEEGQGGIKDNPPVVWFVSFCVLIRKEVIRELGFWDTQFDPGNWEDTDYALRCREAGYDVRVARSVYIHHHCHQTFGKDLKQLMTDNQVKFAEKHGMGKLWDYGLVADREIAIMSGRAAGMLGEAKEKAQ